MKTITRIESYNASPEKIFQVLDDLSVTGMHMTKSSMAMMGSKLHLAFLTENKTGLNTKYRWTGTMMWMDMDFTVLVTKWIAGKEKIWETIGKSKMIIYSWYRMNLVVNKTNNCSTAQLSITYEKPEGWFAKIICGLFADLYCKWCLKNMLGDGKKLLENEKLNLPSKKNDYQV